MVEDETHPRNVRQEIRDGDYNLQVGGSVKITVNLLDVDSCIDEMAELLKNGETLAAIKLGEVLWRRCEERMSDRQRYRVKANMGHAYDWEGDSAKAAEFFFEAFQYDPDYEKARARLALAHAYTGNIEEAHKVATELLTDYQENKLGRAVWVMSAPREKGFTEIEASVPEHQRGHVEVAMALAKRAVIEKRNEDTDKYMNLAKESERENARIDEELGDWMCHKGHLEELASGGRGPTAEERELLNKAVQYYSGSLSGWEQRRNAKGMGRLRRKRGIVQRMLGEKSKYEEDVTTGYNIDRGNPENCFQYAFLKIDQEHIGEGVEILESMVDAEKMPASILLLAQVLWQRNEGDDRNRAIENLRTGLARLNQMPYGFRIDYFGTLSSMVSEIDGKDEAIKVLEEKAKEYISEEVVLVMIARIIGKKGEAGEALNKAKQAYEGITEDTSLEDKRLIAIALQGVGLYKEAFDLWRQIVRIDCIGPDTYRMIECGDRCGAVKEVLELTVGLRRNGIWDREAFEQEIYLRQKYNDWRGCKQILQEYVESPLDETYLPNARAHLSHVAGVLGEIDLIETDLSRLPSPWEVNLGIGRLVVQALRLAGKPEIAIEFAYELVRKHWDAPEAHLIMASFMAPIGPKHVELKAPTATEPGVAVQYKEEGTDVHMWHIIEDSQLGDPNSTRREFSVDHPYSQRMLELKKGDTFLLRGEEIQERRASITEILSKYHYRMRDCMDGFEDKFPENKAVVRINAYGEDGQIDLEPMKRVAEMGGKQGEELLQLHQTQPLPIYFLAMKMGKDIPTTLQHLIGEEGLEVQCRVGNAVEVEEARQALEDIEEIVVDEMTLTTLLFCDVDQHLASIPKKLVVSEGTLLSVENWEVMRVDPNNPGGSIGIADGKLTFVSRTKEGIENAQAKIRQLIRFVRKHCSVESGIVLSNLESSKRDMLVEIVGQTCAESIALACTGRRVFWTDDFATSVLLNTEFGGRRVWTQFIFEYLARQGLIDVGVVRELTLKLVSYGYWFTSLNAETAIEAITKSDWDVNSSPLKEVLAHFGDGRVNVDANLLLLIGRFLKHIWSEDLLGMKASVVTVRMLNELAKRGNSPKLIKALWIWVERLFGVDVLTAQRVKEVFQNWLEVGGGGTIIR